MYEIIGRLTEEQIKELHALYQMEWWTKDRTVADVARMLKHTDVVVGLIHSETKELIAFTRVVTDYVYKALLLDVIVKPTYRGKGLGNVLMNTVLNHSTLHKVKHFELYCRPEMIPFYEKWGFTDQLGNLRFMRRDAQFIEE